jgi:hypothetical protein
MVLGGHVDLGSNRIKDWKPLERRPYRYKKAAMHFFCPLCRTERVITTGHRLSAINYVQIVLVTGFIVAVSFPWAGLKGLFAFFPIWLAFEGVRRLLFSKEVPCPHCGFDASWYKRDVKVARARVAEFWAEQQSQNAPQSSPEVQSEAL